ncbi:hypothetical protein HYX14_01255 [Candidatus Woesearchaeota archaeon]|nr:hypothetical protein [Candidatus Woesearchaeota archaeon]
MKKKQKKVSVAAKKSHASAARKPFVVAVVSIIAVVLLVVILFRVQQLAGKAFFVGEEGTGGFEEPAPATENTPFTAVVKANIGTKQSVGIKFEVALPEGLTCQKVESSLPWTEENGVVLTTAACSTGTCTDPGGVCEPDKVIFEYATLNYEQAKTGTFEVAKITMVSSKAASYKLKFTSFDSIDLDSQTDVIGEGIEADIVVQLPLPKCGDGKVDAGENCQLCPEDVKCAAGQSCVNGACIATAACGNGVKDVGEDCSTCLKDFCTADQTCLNKECVKDVPCAKIGQVGCTKDGTNLVCYNTLCLTSTCATEFGKYAAATGGAACTANAQCNAGEICYAGKKCIPKPLLDATLAACSGIDGYCDIKKGTSGNQCVENDGGCNSEDDCAPGLSCSGTNPAYDPSVKVCSKIKPVKIELMKQGAAVSTVSASNTYNIKITVTPSVDLPAHLIISTVSYGAEQRSQLFERKPVLKAGTSETIEFAHALPGDLKQDVAVKAFVWNSWPSEFVTWSSLLDAAEVKYEIK